MKKIFENFNLINNNTFRLPAFAKLFTEICNKEEIAEVTERFKNTGEKILVLGSGSNILFKENYNGLVIHNKIEGIEEISKANQACVLVKAGGGVIWDSLVNYCTERNYFGIENLAFIPGTAGAAPVQNIGAYGAELKDAFESLEAVLLETGETLELSKEECRFGYRDSIFKNELKGKTIISSVTLRLSKTSAINDSYSALKKTLEESGKTNPSAKEIAEAVKEIRMSKLPNPEVFPNAGSFFKNPEISIEEFNYLKSIYEDLPGYPTQKGVKVPAAWLIEKAGLRGKKIGNAGPFEKQALVIVSYGALSGNEILYAANEIIKKIEEKFNIKLVPEVNIL